MTKGQRMLSPQLIQKRMAQALEHYTVVFGEPPGDKHKTVLEDLAGNPYVTPLEMVHCCKNIKK